jgi:L-iditol 2-dehydrogenase
MCCYSFLEVTVFGVLFATDTYLVAKEEVFVEEKRMEGKMKAAILHRPLNMRIEEVDVPQIGSHDILVKTKRVGICGSDVHYYLEGRIASFVVGEPLILGHECSGEIVEVGDEVTRLETGRRVVVEPGFTCGICHYCRQGRYNLCREVRFYGTPPYDGAFAEFVSAPEQNIHSLPDNMSYEEGAMIEPLAVGMMAAKIGEVNVQDVVAVLGAGTIGQMVLQAVKSYGVLSVYMTDVVDYRLDYAKKYGAKAVINAMEDDVTNKVKELTDNEGVDVVIEASGATTAILQTLDITKPGGRVVLVGYPRGEVQLPLAKVIVKELDVRGIQRYVNVFPTAIRAVSSGKAAVKPFVTHRFPFQKILEGFETHINKARNAVKVQIMM